MRFNYLLLRFMRHVMPEGMARFLLKRRWILQPGLESTDPFSAVSRYVAVLAEAGISITGRRVMVFGYGGRFAVGVDLLKRGASQVVLCDHFVLLDEERNRLLLPAYGEFLNQENGRVLPDPERITLVHGDIRTSQVQSQAERVDLVLSTSVYEHLEDVDGITAALASLTTPHGAHLHFVDLRDHYFKYPFEMLAYSGFIWKTFLNPTSNLNRYRVPQYLRLFEKYFKEAGMTVLERQVETFHRMQGRIRPEFLTGDESVDAVTLIALLARNPY